MCVSVSIFGIWWGPLLNYFQEFYHVYKLYLIYYFLAKLLLGLKMVGVMLSTFVGTCLYHDRVKWWITGLGSPTIVLLPNDINFGGFFLKPWDNKEIKIEGQE
jgi:hypothetical protein